MTQQVFLPQMQGIGRGQTATLKLPPLGFYNDIALEVVGGATSGAEEMLLFAGTDTTPSITEVRIRVDGQVIIQMSGQFWAQNNEYYGQNDLHGIIPLFFDKPWARTVVGQNSTRLAVHEAASVYLEIDFADDYYPHSVRASCSYDLPRRGDSLGYRSIRRTTLSYTGVGKQYIDNIPQNGDLLHSLFIVDPILIDNMHQGIDIMRIKADNAVIYESSADVRRLMRARLGASGGTGDSNIGRELNPEGLICADFSFKGLHSQGIVLNRDSFAVELDWLASPGNFDVYLETTSFDAFAGVARRG
ncbi:MAG: hypothetical protein K8953_05235 [Proteobacteria bacterium]|nr:hypothetical protein [Pseudomonadota bacterium]